MPSWRKVITSGSDASLSNLVVTGGITGSLQGTASYALSALNASTASYYSGSITTAETASYVLPLRQDVTITGSLLLTSSYISTVDYIDFTILPTPPAFNTGRLHWTDDTKTLQLDTDVNNFELEIGHQSVIRGRNNNSFTLTKGTVVYINGESGNRPTFATASWEGDPSSATTIGIVAQDINSSQTGYAVTNGLIRNINTTAFPPGTSLYLSSSGQYTDTPAISPLHEVRLGKTITQAVNGIVYIDIQNGYELGELHDVLITSASTGDLITWDSGSQVWKNTKQLTGSYGLTGSLIITGSTSEDLLRITQTGTGNAFLVEDSANPDATPFVIDNGGNVGIGTTTPNAKLDVSGSAIITGSLTVTQGITGSLFGTASWAQNAATSSYVLNSVSSSFASTASFLNTLNQNLTFNGNLTLNGTASISYLNVLIESASVIYSSGSNQLGDATSDIQTLIGTTVLSGSLQLTGSANLPSITGSLFGTASWARNATTASYSETASYVNPLQQNVLVTGSVNIQTSAVAGAESLQRWSISDSNTQVQLNNVTTAPGVFLPGLISFQESGSSVIGITYQSRIGADTGTNPGILFEARSGSAATITTRPLFLWRNYTTEYMLMDATGSLGLGTSSPSAKLHVNNTGAGNSFLVEDSTNPDTSPFIIDASGNVGIGTTSPTAKLTVSASNVNGILLGTNTGAGLSEQSTRLFFGQTDPAKTVTMYATSGGLNIATNGEVNVSSGTTRMFVSSSGNVGIRTTTPTLGTLQVNGNVFATSFTGSLQGTSSWAQNAVTASFITTAQTASYVLNAVSSSFSSTASYLNTLNQDLTFNGNLTLNGTASITYLNVVFETASVILSTGSNQLGDATNDTQRLIGTVIVSGSQQITGSLNAPSITGSLQGTASWAVSASNVASTSNAFIQGGNSFGATAILGTNDTRDLSIETNNVVRMTISGSSGETGLGIAPVATVRLATSGTIGINNTVNSVNGGVYIDHTGVQTWRIGVSASSTSTLSIGNDLGGAFAGKHLNITNAGSVGIGTTTPSTRFDVSGSVYIASGLNNNSTRPTVIAGALNAGELRGYSSTAPTADDGFLRLSAGGGLNANAKTYIDITGFSNVTDMRYNIVFGTAGAEKMRLTEAGNVGIGISAPAARLHVSGGAETIRIETSASIGSGPYMTFYGNNTLRGYVGYGASTTNQLLLMNIASGSNDSLNLGTNSLVRLTVSSSGEVGIGTSYTSPSSLLSIRSPVNSSSFDVTNAGETPFKYRIINSGSGTINGVTFKSGLYYNNLENATVNFFRGGSTTGGFLTFNTSNGTERMRIDANGNVGIGNTNPPNTLSVSNAGATAGTTATYALAVQRSNVTDITLGSDASFAYLQSWVSKPLLLNSHGNTIGINKTTTPNAALDVNGNTIITGSLSVTSVVNGTGSFVTIDANNTFKDRTAAEVRVDINYYGLTYAMQNGYY